VKPVELEEHDRPIPFAIRIATDWLSLDSEADDFHVWVGRARLTGQLLTTSGGHDVTFSDLGINQ
jgi:hypothetical protein